MSDMTLAKAILSMTGIVSCFRDCLPRYKELDNYRIRVFILTLGLYLYCKYILSGRRLSESSDLYNIQVRTMKTVFPTQKLVDAASNVIRIRNLIAHSTWNIATSDKINELIDSKDFLELLKYESLIDDELNFIEPEGGEYKPLMHKVDFTKKEDEETKEEPKSALQAALDKMSGN